MEFIYRNIREVEEGVFDVAVDIVDGENVVVACKTRVVAFEKDLQREENAEFETQEEIVRHYIESAFLPAIRKCSDLSELKLPKALPYLRYPIDEPPEESPEEPPEEPIE